MPTQMQPVVSSNIASVGYDDATQVLTVNFNTGRTYRYAGVPQQEYESLLNAGSVGQYFSQNIKNVFRLA